MSYRIARADLGIGACCSPQMRQQQVYIKLPAAPHYPLGPLARESIGMVGLSLCCEGFGCCANLAKRPLAIGVGDVAGCWACVANAGSLAGTV